MIGKFKQLPMLFILALAALHSTAQKDLTYKQATKKLDASQKSFTRMLGNYPMDKNGKAMLNHFITNEIDSLQQLIKSNNDIPDAMKIQAITCQCYLLDTLQRQVSNKSFDINLIRDSRDNFIPLWESMLSKKPNDMIMQKFDPESATLMAAVFRDFPEADRMRDMAMLKTLERQPDNIMLYLDKNPAFGMRDSLIFIAANNTPEKVLFYLANSRNTELVNAIKSNNSALVQTMVAVANERNLKNYLPFLEVIAEKKMTLADVDRLRTQRVHYYQSMVDDDIAAQTLKQSGGTPLYVWPTRQYIKEYGITFYTDVINSMHEEPNEKIRFEALNELRPQDLYYIITNGETELYTSSYLYSYRRLMKAFDKTTSDAVFDLVKYDQFGKFMLMAGR